MDNQLPENHIGAKLYELRKAAGMTQEQLANKLGLSFQAISKWENGQSCPDILLLPEISRIFGISTDELLGSPPRSPSANPTADMISGLPWANDQTIRLVLFQGHHLVKDNAGQTQDLIFKYEGPALNVTSQISINCNDIAQNATAGLSIQCGDIGGDCIAGKVINCGDVGGDCHAGSDVNCGDVGGDCHAGRDIRCGDVGGDCRAEGRIS